MSKAPHMVKCSRCGKRFTNPSAAEQHILMRHKGRGDCVDAPRPESEESLADLAIEAEQRRAAGESLSGFLKGLLP